MNFNERGFVVLTTIAVGKLKADPDPRYSDGAFLCSPCLLSRNGLGGDRNLRWKTFQTIWQVIL